MDIKDINFERVYEKLDPKTVAIIVLSFALIISLIFWRTNVIDYHKSEITNLEHINDSLKKRNETLMTINTDLDSKLKTLGEEKNALIAEKSKIQSQLDRLKNKRNEIPTYVNNLSANGVDNAFTEYLTKRTKSSDNH